MSIILRAIVAAFELFNKIATRLREIRIERAIKRDITNKAKDDVDEAKKKVKEKLRKKYNLFPDSD